MRCSNGDHKSFNEGKLTITMLKSLKFPKESANSSIALYWTVFHTNLSTSSFM